MKLTQAFFLALLPAAAAASGANPYIAKVYDFRPAPGQFIHSVPQVTDDMGPDEVLEAVAAQICGNEEDGATPGMISLGAFGGYVVVGFDHPVVNVAGEPDLKFHGNAFRSQAGSAACASEPGIVMVSVDANGNGLPDDEWFELKGSAHDNPATVENFTVTYRRPANETDDVTWTSDNPLHPSGTVGRNPFHTQDYWPGWLGTDELTFTGTRLPDNATETVVGEESNWELNCFEWGYVDNLPSNEDTGLDISNAVDAAGNPVDLTHIDFVKIYTAMNQTCGWIGETSTEVRGGEDLHPLASLLPVAATPAGGAGPVVYYDMQGRRVDHPAPGSVVIECRDGRAKRIKISTANK